MKSSGADAVLIVMTEQSCATFMRQFREVGLTLQTFSRGSCVSGLFNQLTKDNPSIGEGIVEYSFFSEGQDTQLDKHFFEVYNQPITPHRLSGYYAMTYAYVPAIRQLIKDGKEINRANIQAALTKIQVTTPGGPIQFDDHNQAYPNGTMSTNKAGGTVLLGTSPLKPVDHTGY
jgi:ABC-type branched-subunit amino acid transport system substrate-binding protein